MMLEAKTLVIVLVKALFLVMTVALMTLVVVLVTVLEMAKVGIDTGFGDASLSRLYSS